jgi:hypothetical protein
MGGVIASRSGYPVLVASVAAIGLSAGTAFPAPAANQLVLERLAPAKGDVAGVAAGAMVRGNSIRVTFRYLLRSAQKGKIGVYTAGVAGNPPHTGVEIPVVVQKGRGTIQTRFSVRCEADSPAAVPIVNVRYVLFQIDAGGAIGKPLVEKVHSVKYRFLCPQPQGHPAPDGRLPDLTSQKGITIGGGFGGAGGKSSPWGGTIALTRAEAFLQVGGNCAFNISYDLTNRGPVAASPKFSNAVRAGEVEVSQQTGLTLNAGETRQIRAQAYLALGTRSLALIIDKDNLVTESDETNNTFTIDITLDETCAR